MSARSTLSLDDHLEHAPSVSVVVPMFNGADTVRRCLESVLTQSVQDIEVVVVDDSSTDNGAELVKEWAMRDTRVRYLKNPRNLMLGATRNIGIRHARAPYVFLLDVDDHLLPDAVAVLLDKARGTGADVVQGGSLRHHVDGRMTPYHAYDFESSGGQPLVQLLARHRFASVAWNKLYKRDLLCGDEPILFDEHMMHEDVPFALEVACRARLVSSVARPVICYAESPAGLTGRPPTAYNIDSYFSVYLRLIELCTRYRLAEWPDGLPLVRQLFKAHGSDDLAPKLIACHKAMGASAFEQALSDVAVRRAGLHGAAVADMLASLVALSVERPTKDIPVGQRSLYGPAAVNASWSKRLLAKLRRRRA